MGFYFKRENTVQDDTNPSNFWKFISSSSQSREIYWANTITTLNSNNLIFVQYGISGPYWYAGGATIQIIIFSILSIMLKTRAPGAKTFLQVSTTPRPALLNTVTTICTATSVTILASDWLIRRNSLLWLANQDPKLHLNSFYKGGLKMIDSNL